MREVSEAEDIHPERRTIGHRCILKKEAEAVARADMIIRLWKQVIPSDR
jgi:hypothetical protein